MKQKAKSIQHLKSWTLAALTATIAFSGCQKELSNQTVDTPEIKKATIQLSTKTNPFSLRNVEKAKATLLLIINLHKGFPLINLLEMKSNLFILNSIQKN